MKKLPKLGNLIVQHEFCCVLNGWKTKCKTCPLEDSVTDSYQVKQWRRILKMDTKCKLSVDAVQRAFRERALVLHPDVSKRKVDKYEFHELKNALDHLLRYLKNT